MLRHLHKTQVFFLEVSGQKDKPTISPGSCVTRERNDIIGG